jgi:hypothetical protein
MTSELSVEVLETGDAAAASAYSERNIHVYPSRFITAQLTNKPQ